MTPAERLALQVTSAWVVLLTKCCGLDEGTTWATIRHEGAVIAECSIAEALDMANAVLEPEGASAMVPDQVMGQ